MKLASDSIAMIICWVLVLVMSMVAIIKVHDVREYAVTEAKKEVVILRKEFKNYKAELTEKLYNHKHRWNGKVVVE